MLVQISCLTLHSGWSQLMVALRQLELSNCLFTLSKTPIMQSNQVLVVRWLAPAASRRLSHSKSWAWSASSSVPLQYSITTSGHIRTSNDLSRRHSDDLADKSIYQYFIRLVAQCAGPGDILVVHSVGSYGENEVSQLISAIQHLCAETSFVTCVAMSIEVPSNPSDDDLNDVTAALTSDTRAIVIVSFLNPDDQTSLFPLLVARAGLGSFVFG